MANRRYQSGREFEYRVKHDLEKRGYYCIRAAGSHSKVDLVAVKGAVCLFVQCKTDGRISAEEWDKLYAIRRAPAFLPLVARKDDRGRVEYMLIEAPRTSQRREWQPFDPGEDGVV